MNLLTAHLICAFATWLALVSDGMLRMTPRHFVRALRRDVEIFGASRVVAWVVACLFCWPIFWIAWLCEWVDDS